MKNGKSVIRRGCGIGIIPLSTLLVMLALCASWNIVLLESELHWRTFFQSVASVMLTTFALSINLNSGRFDFSIGSISLLSSVISARICIGAGWNTTGLLVPAVGAGIVLGALSGIIYIIVKLPPIIVSLGVALFYEGMAFTITKGKGVNFVTNLELTSFPGVLNYLLIMAAGLGIVIFLFDYTRFGYEYRALVSGQRVAVSTGIKEAGNAIVCYAISGGLMGAVGFISASKNGNIMMSLNFGSIGVMFTAFLPMFIGGFIGRFCNERIGYLLGAVTTALISLLYARLNVDASVSQITTAFILVAFLIYLNNEGKLKNLFLRKNCGKRTGGNSCGI